MKSCESGIAHAAKMLLYHLDRSTLLDHMRRLPDVRLVMMMRERYFVTMDNGLQRELKNIAVYLGIYSDKLNAINQRPGKVAEMNTECNKGEFDIRPHCNSHTGRNT